MSGTVLTNKGLALITKLVAASTELQISRVAVGTGRVPSGVDPQTMVDLNEYKMDAQIESYGVSPDQSDVAYIAAQVSSIGVSAGFAVTEAGVFATDPDVGEILYAYLDLTEDPQYIYAETDAISKFAEITFNVLIGSVAKVTAYVSPGALTKKVDFNAFKESVETPEFDDSGTVSGISSFPDFLNLVKSKMNFFQFFRNFKAGMQFVLHAGQIVNNCVTDNAGLPLSAAQGKVLKDLYTQLYSDLSKLHVNYSYNGTDGINDVYESMSDMSSLHIWTDGNTKIGQELGLSQTYEGCEVAVWKGTAWRGGAIAYLGAGSAAQIGLINGKNIIKWYPIVLKSNLESGYLKIKVYDSCIRLVQKTVSFTNGIGYIPLSEIFESFNPTYAIGVSQPIDLGSEGIALVSVSKDGNNMKIALNKSYTGTKWVSFIAIGSL